MSRIMTIWIPKWPVQRRLVEQPERRKIPLLVCRREPRGVMTVVSMALGERVWKADRGGSRAEGAAVSPIRPGPSPIRPGLSLAETLAAISIAHGSKACRMAEIEADDPVADRMVLEGIARWCRRFSPIVAIESTARPERIHVDITGTSMLFGGEESVVRTAVWTLASRGLYVRAAVADTPAAATAAASTVLAASPVLAAPAAAAVTPAAAGCAAVKEGDASLSSRTESFLARQNRCRSDRGRRRFCIVAAGKQATQLADLPVSALGKESIGEKAITSLAELGVTTIGQLLRLPRKSLASRFGERLERRIAEFLGTCEEPLDALRDDAFPTAECRLAAPAATLDAIRSVIDGLVGRCIAPLAARGHGVTALQVRLESAVFESAVFESAVCDASSGKPPIVIDIGLFRPSTSVKHLVELVELRLSRMHLPGEVESVAVEVIAAGAVTCRQKTLFGKQECGGDSEADASSVEMLLDRLAGRLGRRAVFEPKPLADAQPEHAWTPAAPTAVTTAAVTTAAVTLRAKDSKAGSSLSRSVRDGSVRDGSSAVALRSRRVPVRPIWLVPRPVRLEAVSIVPDGPPLRFRLGPESHRIVSAHGPERIETAWWRGECVRRDYYVVETESGSRWWLFRRLRDGVWFLHGQFA